MYKLFRSKDGKGDSGSLSLGLWNDDKGILNKENNARPRVGIAIRVGSPRSRTYEKFDYWTTTYITQIILDTPNRVVFKTKNSLYEWLCD